MEVPLNLEEQVVKDSICEKLREATNNSSLDRCPNCFFKAMYCKYLPTTFPQPHSCTHQQKIRVVKFLFTRVSMEARNWFASWVITCYNPIYGTYNLLTQIIIHLLPSYYVPVMDIPVSITCFSPFRNFPHQKIPPS